MILGKKMMNTRAGEKIQDVVCKECKQKVAEQTQKLKKVDILFPQRVAKKFSALLCDECKAKVRKRLQK